MRLPPQRPHSKATKSMKSRNTGYASSKLNRLDLNKLVWRLMPVGANPETEAALLPKNVEKTSVVTFQKSLFVFGGFGDKPDNPILEGKSPFRWQKPSSSRDDQQDRPCGKSTLELMHK